MGAVSYEVRAGSIGRVLDTGFRLVREHFVPLVGIALSVTLPVEVLARLVTGMRSTPNAQAIGSAVGLLLVALIVSPIVSAAITHAVSEAYLGHEVRLLDSLTVGLRLFMRLLGTAMLMTLLTALGFVLLVVPGLYLMLAWLLTYQVMVIEGLSGWEALQRTRKLSAGHLMRILGVLLVASILMLVVGGVLELVIRSVPVLSVLVSAVVQAVFSAYMSAALVVLYFDIRCRKEAFDLEHLAELVSGQGAPALSGG